MKNNYSEANIKILKGLDAVKKRPGMYIGSTDSRGFHHLLWEILDNCVDEVLSGFANTIAVVLHAENQITVSDNGRGIPFETHSDSKISTIDTVFTYLHAGGKFDNDSYKIAGGLHGVGASVVNALSDQLQVTVKRQGKVYRSVYENGGKIKQKAHCIGNAKIDEHGTSVTFRPDPKVFKKIHFDSELIRARLKELAFLFKKLQLTFVDETGSGEKEVFFTEAGISQYLDELNADSKQIAQKIFVSGTEDDIELEAVFQFIDGEDEKLLSFANSIRTSEGGSHEASFRQSVGDVINNYCRKYNFLKERDKNFEASEIREGLNGIIKVNLPEKIIAFEGQTKSKLFSKEVKAVVQKLTQKHFFQFLERNSVDAKLIVEKLFYNRKLRQELKQQRQIKKNLSNPKAERILFGKLAPAQSKKVAERELFVVEGDSAGGTAKMGRDRFLQAILPLRGKVLNVEKINNKKEAINNEELLTLIFCIGTGIGNNFTIRDRKYDKIIIMTDADNDGAHIQILLLTFFYRYMKPLIEKGHIYLALPPLYKFEGRDKKARYLWTEQELEQYRAKHSHFNVQRYKGLGEMNADQLWETTMNPMTRKLIQVKLDNFIQAEKQINVFMGDKTELRKSWIEANINFSSEN
ncbi:DNA topoisomerase IV subunit B [Mycoplasmoides pneumoniae]|uniref:DNA topoisomerase 4 subunit B n=1 Tax=Mycoplasma pneumoniae (strain ATCC 29342 / M129 / Subtype 1) TaxID=272634 RepID=PARE_MYCPN|nr:DNA topoisomerase IV subunit B [Mycoplasmoides pneumoniae]P78016.1 RecName: Full=DNA topoisomerase 4 subunit B; AltName: Full=Topoisomerase IV subunit B [Mycoplasmoides pneumoniae M129]AAB95680.1 topoisomerase IV subunit B [Mycoplasmoides pneumoniae M129]AGC04050.1 DNA gyrase subunit B [Mycoplasmoides pneumoniae M129-B7]ALA30006.1 DNA gyrase subunit B [Mycoplasmoides pneumoniae PI 1428]ALA32119.1 DNA gyrase subunit B [Mycoplasmoides pneumoniae 51494]ALA32821.1 DNA gyrase subunit B [Mycopla